MNKGYSEPQTIKATPVESKYKIFEAENEHNRCPLNSMVAQGNYDDRFWHPPLRNSCSSFQKASNVSPESFQHTPSPAALCVHVGRSLMGPRWPLNQSPS